MATSLETLPPWAVVRIVCDYLLLDETQALWRSHRTLRDTVDGHTDVLVTSLVHRGVCEKPSSTPRGMGGVYRHVLRENYMLCVSDDVPHRIRDVFHVTYTAIGGDGRRFKRKFDAVVHPCPSNPGSVSVIDTVHSDPRRRRLLYSNVKRHPIDPRTLFLRWHA